jgi:hypothetical protein
MSKRTSLMAGIIAVDDEDRTREERGMRSEK